jgi:hypothetical protein
MFYLIYTPLELVDPQLKLDVKVVFTCLLPEKLSGKFLKSVMTTGISYRYVWSGKIYLEMLGSRGFGHS